VRLTEGADYAVRARREVAAPGTRS
jgi:hypothetical protein